MKVFLLFYNLLDYLLLGARSGGTSTDEEKAEY